MGGGRGERKVSLRRDLPTPARHASAGCELNTAPPVGDSVGCCAPCFNHRGGYTTIPAERWRQAGANGAGWGTSARRKRIRGVLGRECGQRVCLLHLETK